MMIKTDFLKIVLMVFLFGMMLNCGGGKNVKDDIKVGDVNDMYGAGSKVVIAEGLAEVRAAGVPEAYDRAKEAALKKAIEKALGTIIDARIIGSSGVILEENIYAKKQGYIREYKIISKKVEGGVAYMTVKAVVGLQKLKDDVMALDILHHRMNMPKTIILVNEINVGKPSKANAAYNVLVKKFSEKRFTIIGPQNIDKKLKRNIKRLFTSVDSDENTLISIAGKIGVSVNADIVIVGKAISEKAKNALSSYSKNLKSYQADVFFKVVNVGDGRIIAETSKHAAAVHLTDLTGGVNAIKKATKAAADDLTTQIIKAWEDILNNGNLITLYAKGLSITDEILFSKDMKRYFREVKEIYSKQRKGNTSVFTVRFLGSPKDLAAALVTKETFPYKTEVLKYDFGEVSVKIKKKK